METLNEAIEKLIKYWEDQKIGSNGKNFQEIEHAEKTLNVKLPQDFISYFKAINGMGNSHINDTDKKGFSFYQLEDLSNFDNNFKDNDVFSKGKRFVLFADYLQKCWCYLIAIELNESIDKYSIVVYLDFENYKIVANSLQEFIALYIADSSVLYDYS